MIMSLQKSSSSIKPNIYLHYSKMSSDDESWSDIA